jgi:hypothetical protein
MPPAHQPSVGPAAAQANSINGRGREQLFHHQYLLSPLQKPRHKPEPRILAWIQIIWH